MISVVEIASRLQEKKEYDFDEREKFTWRPVTTNDYVLPAFKITESNAKGARAKRITKLSKVLAFVDSVKHRRAKTGCTLMPISCMSKANCLIWGNKFNASKAIKYMIQIGLISVDNSSYRFNAPSERDNTCRVYRYYKENEDKLVAYCKEHSIKPYCVQNIIVTDDGISEMAQDIDRSKVRFSSRLNLRKPDCLSKSEFEKLLALCLYENYHGLRLFIELANEINERYYQDYPEFRIRFSPRFTWSKDDTYVKGIGIRATNSMINIKKEDRPNILKSYGFTLEKDINASVPRITLSLNSGHWVDESNDIYERIFRVMSPEGKFTDEEREAIKELHMRVYFESGDKLTGHHTWLAMDQRNIEKEDVCDTMTELRDAIIAAEGGKLYGNEIFCVESCIYLMTL